MITGITKDWDFWELFVPQIFRGVGLMICMVPINNIALGTLVAGPAQERLRASTTSPAISAARSGSRSSIRSSTTASTCISSACARASTGAVRQAMETLNALTHEIPGSRLGRVNAAALKTMSNMVRKEALVMSFADVFLLLTLLFLALACALPFIKKPRAAPSGGGGH